MILALIAAQSIGVGQAPTAPLPDLNGPRRFVLTWGESEALKVAWTAAVKVSATAAVPLSTITPARTPLGYRIDLVAVAPQWWDGGSTIVLRLTKEGRSPWPFVFHFDSDWQEQGTHRSHAGLLATLTVSPL